MSGIDLAGIFRCGRELSADRISCYAGADGYRYLTNALAKGLVNYRLVSDGELLVAGIELPTYVVKFLTGRREVLMVGNLLWLGSEVVVVGIIFRDLSKWQGEKLEGCAVELVDCMIRILDWFGKTDLDLEDILKKKMEYNKDRPYKHGGKRI